MNPGLVYMVGPDGTLQRSMDIAAEVLREEKCVAWMDISARFNPDMAKDLGIEVEGNDLFWLLQPWTEEQVLTILNTLVDNQVDLVVLYHAGAWQRGDNAVDWQDELSKILPRCTHTTILAVAWLRVKEVPFAVLGGPVWREMASEVIEVNVPAMQTR